MKKYIQKVGLSAAGGMVCFLAEAGLTVLLTEVVGLWSKISYAIALILGLLGLFYFHRHLTFRVKSNKSEQLAKFYALYGTSYFANWILVAVLSIFINYVYAIIVVGITLWPLNFLGNDMWVFRKNNTQE